MNAEPQLEELSAYLDHELTGSARQELESHLAGCETCRRRLDALKATVQAVRGLPLETPARTFTIPAQRRQAVRWEPLAWVGGLAAAALLVVGIGLWSNRGGASSPSLTAGGSLSLTQPRVGTGATTQADRAAAAAPRFEGPNQVTVSDSRNPSRTLALSTDAKTYGHSSQGMAVQVAVEGVPQVAGANVLDQGQVRLFLVRGGSGIELPLGACSVSSTTGRGGCSGIDSFSALALPSPRAGAYQLLAMWSIPDGSGTILVAELPVELTP